MRLALLLASVGMLSAQYYPPAGGGTGGSVAASSVTAGTFGVGNYVFPGNVTVGTSVLDAATSGIAAGGLISGTNLNIFTAFSGPGTSLKTFALPNASATILTTNAAVTGAQGGTGVANTGLTVTLSGNVVTTGAFDLKIASQDSLVKTMPTGTVTLQSTTGSLASNTGLPSAGLNITTTTCSSQFISSLSSGAVGTCSSLTAGEIPNVPVTISTSGAVADPGGAADYQFNNAAGALTFNAPAGAAGLQRCYKQQTGKSGAITIQMASSNTVDVAGVNGSSAGTLVSAGALADAVCLVSDATNHWHAYITSGNWTNN